MHVDERIARLASGQHGLVTVGQLRRLGVGRGSIAHRLRVGRLHRVRTGVFAVGHPSLSPEARLLAAVMACGEHAILSHQHAADLWELLPPWIELDLAAINVSVPPGSRRGRRPGLEVHRLEIEDRDRAARRGIPVTSPSRTLVDLANRVAPRTLERAIDQALTDRLVTAPGLHSALDRAGSSRGTRSLRALLAATERFETVTQSELEEAFLVLVRRAALPMPALNVPLLGRRVDAVWSAQRVAVELDGFRWHRTRRRMESGLTEAADLRRAGWVPVRYSARQVFDEPMVVVADLAPLLVRRQA